MNEGTVMILKLRPTHNEAFPPGYLDGLEYPPEGFDGHAWLSSLPVGVINSDIEYYIAKNSGYFRDSDIWYYACFPHEKKISIWQLCTFVVLRSIISGKIDQAMLISADHRGVFDSAIVIHNEDKKELGRSILSQMCLSIDDWKGHSYQNDWDFWDKYDAPSWYRDYKAGRDFSDRDCLRVIP